MEERVRNQGGVGERPLRRNPLTVRWTDDEHRAVTDKAWKRRQSASELIRDLVLRGLVQLKEVGE